MNLYTAMASNTEKFKVKITELINDFVLGDFYYLILDSLNITELKLLLAARYKTEVLYINLQLEMFQVPYVKGFRRTQLCHNLEQNDIVDGCGIFVQIFNGYNFFSRQRMSNDPFRSTISDEDTQYFKLREIKFFPVDKIKIGVVIDFYNISNLVLGNGIGALFSYNFERYQEEINPKKTVAYDYYFDVMMPFSSLKEFIIMDIVEKKLVARDDIAEIFTKKLSMINDKDFACSRGFLDIPYKVPIINFFSDNRAKLQIGCYATLSCDYLHLTYNPYHFFAMDGVETLNEKVNIKINRIFTVEKLIDLIFNSEHKKYLKIMRIIKDGNEVKSDEFIHNVYKQNDHISYEFYDKKKISFTLKNPEISTDLKIIPPPSKMGFASLSDQ